ncbi:MAG: hypothetical protein KJT01_06510 [Gemmatimonadetes bacterium]|nr:hypothetical protein [Gemmatimonadota bacterium]
MAGPRSTEQGGTLNPRQVVVDISGSPPMTFEVPDSDPTATTWYRREFTFKATSAATTLTFAPPLRGRPGLLRRRHGFRFHAPSVAPCVARPQHAGPD